MRCPSCGHESSEGSQFCVGCGKPLSTEPLLQESSSTEATASSPVQPVTTGSVAAESVESPAAIRKQSRFEPAWAVLAILLYLTLADAAVETWLQHSPLRIWIAGALGAYLLLGLSLSRLWQRWNWTTQAWTSLIFLLAVLGATAWSPGGLDQGLRLAGQPTSTVLAAISAAAIALAGFLLVRLAILPRAGKVLGGLLAAYGVAAFVLAAKAGTSYRDVFHGASLWSRLPFWLQGATVGGLFVVAIAIVLAVVNALTGHTGGLPRLALNVTVLSLCLAMSLAGLRPLSRAPVIPSGPYGAKPPIVTQPAVAEASPPPVTPPVTNIAVNSPVVAKEGSTGMDTHIGLGTVSATVPPGTNIVAADFGGEIESMTGTCGPGLTGRRLIDGSPDTAWIDEPDTRTRARVTLPHEIVFSFYKRDAALVTAVALTLGKDALARPKDVEVWTSMDNHPSEGFSRIALVTLQRGPDVGDHRTTEPGVQVISFPPVEARYVKLRVLSTFDDDPHSLEIDELQIIEGSQPGYRTLLARNPGIPKWKTSVRHAAQLGIEWLQPAAIRWQAGNSCFGCHVQSQVLMGLAVARTNGYVVSQNCMTDLATFTRMKQTKEGIVDFHNGEAKVTPTAFAAMGIAYFDEVTGVKHDDVFLKYVTWLAEHQDRTGALLADWREEPPIVQGSFMNTGNGVVAYMQAFMQTGDARYQQAADRGIAFLALAKTANTQDEVFKILALSRFGTPEQRQNAARVVAQLQSEQGEDGGWRETPNMKGSNAFATGQVLYAFKEGGVSTNSPGFIKGVRFLLNNQNKETGAWPSKSTQSNRPSEFAPTMWAVIGLAGSFADVEEPTAESLKAELDKTGRIVLYINFDFNKATIRPDGKPIIAQVLKLLKDHPDLAFSIAGHTDNVGTHDYNVKLSGARAAAVVDALVRAGIPPNRLSSSGSGQGSPIADNNTEEGRAKNRRVELVKR